MEFRMPPDSAVIGESVKRAVPEEGLVVRADPDRRVFCDEAKQLLACPLQRCGIGVRRQLELHVLKLALPLLLQIGLEVGELIRLDKVVLHPASGLGVGAVVVNHGLLEQARRERDPAELLDERTIGIGQVDVEVDVRAADERRQVVASERVAQLVDLRLDAERVDRGAIAPEKVDDDASPASPHLLHERPLVPRGQRVVEDGSRLGVEVIANRRLPVEDVHPIDKDDSVGLRQLEKPRTRLGGVLGRRLVCCRFQERTCGFRVPG